MSEELQINFQFLSIRFANQEGQGRALATVRLRAMAAEQLVGLALTPTPDAKWQLKGAKADDWALLLLEDSDVVQPLVNRVAKLLTTTLKSSWLWECGKI